MKKKARKLNIYHFIRFIFEKETFKFLINKQNVNELENVLELWMSSKKGFSQPKKIRISVRSIKSQQDP